jgi:hypothetical protein
MKKLLLFFVVWVVGLQQPACQATLVTYAASAAPNLSPDANSNTVDVWTVTTSGAGAKGSFLGNSAGNGGAAGAGTSAWGIFAQNNNNVFSTTTVSSLVGRPLSLAGDFLSLDFDNGDIDTSAVVGIRLFDINNNSQATFRFTGGQSNYEIADSTTSSTGVGFTLDGFNVKFSLNNTSGGYTLQIGATTLSGRTLSQGTSQITYVQVFNMGAGSGSSHDVFFNNLTLSTVPETSAVLTIPVALVIAGTFRTVIRRNSKRANSAKA